MVDVDQEVRAFPKAHGCFDEVAIVWRQTGPHDRVVTWLDHVIEIEPAFVARDIDLGSPVTEIRQAIGLVLFESGDRQFFPLLIFRGSRHVPAEHSPGAVCARR